MADEDAELASTEETPDAEADDSADSETQGSDSGSSQSVLGTSPIPAPMVRPVSDPRPGG